MKGYLLNTVALVGIITFTTCFNLDAQTMDSILIVGKVISENMDPLPEVKIYDTDSVILGFTEMDGSFEVKVPLTCRNLLFGFIGMEWTLIEIENDCKNYEVIMLLHVIYDFMTTNRINRKRKKRIKQMQKIHTSAYASGFFVERKPCFCYVFQLE